QQAAEPAVVDVRLAGRLGDLLDPVAGLLLGADEQHRAAAVGDLGSEALGLLEQALRLEQIDDVDAGALAEDEAAHLRVPAARLLAEVDSGLQQLLDADFGHRGDTPFVRLDAATRASEESRTGRVRTPCRAAASGVIARGRGYVGSQFTKVLCEPCVGAFDEPV